MSEENKDDNLENDGGGFEDSDDSFGLPNVDYKPLEEENEDTADSYNIDYQGDDEEGSREYDREDVEEKKKSYTGLIVTIILVVLLGGGGTAGYFLFWVPLQESNKLYAEKIKVADGHFEGKLWAEAKTAYEEAGKVKPKEIYPKNKIKEIEDILAAEAKKAAEEAARLAAEAAEAAKQPVAPPPGTVEVLDSRTGRYHVVVTSNVDEDLAMDYAKRISLAGTSAKLLKATGKSLYNRVSISDFDTYAEAQTHADGVKAEFANAWVVKY